MTIPMIPPTEAERLVARKVLAYYFETASMVLTKTDQETPHEWARGAEVWIDLLGRDPEKEMLDYLEEYKAGHDKFADE